MKFFKKQYDIELFMGGDQFKIRRPSRRRGLFFWKEYLLIDIPCVGPEGILEYVNNISSFFEEDEKSQQCFRYLLSEDRYALFLLMFS